MKSDNKKLRFLSGYLSNMAIFGVLLSGAAMGIISIFHLGEKIKTYYYSFYLIYCLIFILLLLIRIPFYLKEKKNDVIG